MANFDQKDSFKRNLVFKQEIERKLLKALSRNQSLPQDLRYDYLLKLQTLPKQSSLSQIVRRCVLSGRSHAVLRKFKVSRIHVRQLLAKGQLQGSTKSSW